MAILRAWEAAYRPFARVRLDDSEPSSDGLRRSWVMLMPEGEFSHPEYGKLEFDRKKLATFKRHFDERVRKIDIAFDLDHDAKAATGWLERICFGDEIGREPGLWGLTAWTPLGIQKLQDRIYRYFSPEFGDYTDEETGEVYQDVIIGGALTNRPFLKVMPAVALADVSTRPWSSIDKTKLPDSCFLDPANRRLPVYEGAGAVGADGKYTRRGKLNSNGLYAAKAAVFGARSGTPMRGLPAGVTARIERLLARCSGSQAGSQSSTASEVVRQVAQVGEDGVVMRRKMTGKRGISGGAPSVLDADEQNRRVFMGVKSAKGVPTPAQDDADGDQQMYDDDTLDDDTLDDDTLDDDTLDDGTDESMDDGTDDSSAMDDDTLDDESMDDGTDESMDDDSAEGAGVADAALSKKGVRTMKATKGSRRASRRMSKKASEPTASTASARRGGDTVTLREQRLARQLAETNARMVELERKSYASEVEKILNGWDAGKYQFSESRIKNPDAGAARSRSVRVALGRSARVAISQFLLSERAFRMSAELRDEICRLFELAAVGAVDLSVRGSSFDQEERKTIRVGGAAQDDSEQERMLDEQVEALALSEYRKPVNKLTHAELAEVQQRAASMVGYR